MANRELGLLHLTEEQALWLCQPWCTKEDDDVPFLKTSDGFELCIYPINSECHSVWRGTITDTITNTNTTIRTHSLLNIFLVLTIK